MSVKTEIAVFAGGCFWCTEAVFSELAGVISVMPGYTGGPVKSRKDASRPRDHGVPPTYEEVSSGSTGHAEVSKVEFDPSQVTYNDLLTVFFATHDPTTLNRQGADVGTQYRSAIFTTTPGQADEAKRFIEKLDEEGPKVVTEVLPLGDFYPADESHRQYYLRNSEQAYCQVVISPKLEKLKAKFESLLKK